MNSTDISRLLLSVCAGALLAGCQNVVEHHDVGSTVAASPQTPVARVNDRAIGAAELRLEMQRSGASADAAVQALIDREILLQSALSGPVADDTLPVKSSMVRALLEDEIERKVGPGDVPDEKLDALVPTVQRELSRPQGFRIAAISIFVPTKVDGEAPTPENLAQWTELAKREAERVRDWLREDPTAARMRTFDASSLPKPLGASVRADMTVASPAEVARSTLPEGWTPNAPLSAAATSIEDGEVGIVDVGPAFFVFARLGVEPRVVPTDDATRAEALERALTEVRRERLEQWLETLRGAYDVDLYPEVIAESAQGTETYAPE